MGAWGHGLYDNDDALDIVNSILDDVGVNSDKDGNRIIPMANNTILDGEWNPSLGKLHQVVIRQIFDNFKVIEKRLIDKGWALDQDKTSRAEKYLVLCNILQHHGYGVPEKSAKRAYKAISYLLKPNCEATNDYDNPSARKNAINKVLNQIALQEVDVGAKIDNNVEPEKVTVITKTQKKNNLK